MGYEVNNEPFKNHSWYFSNALVRANYENVRQGIVPATVHLERFFENQLCGTRHELKNRYLHLDWPQEDISNILTSVPQVTDQVTDQVRALLDALGDRELSAMELMNSLGLSHRQPVRPLEILNSIDEQYAIRELVLQTASMTEEDGPLGDNVAGGVPKHMKLIEN